MTRALYPLTQLSLRSPSSYDPSFLPSLISSSRNAHIRSTSKPAEKCPCSPNEDITTALSNKVSCTLSTSRTLLNTITILDVAREVTTNGGQISGRSLTKVVNDTCPKKRLHDNVVLLD
eukprot:TRINITY_DN19814_c0_g2_i1.p1 TRINITY_DN19814_c0_g2~~TRINITY_DN19814_c0_g2_i1.p1  ORF type:complete len:119 (-),score=7.70 TRINITY_DN19814_c0_g2_i1:171-527(-)